MANLKMAAMAGLASALISLAACTTVEETSTAFQKPDELSRISVLAVDNHIQIKPDDTFSWQDDMAIVGLDKEQQNKIAAVLTADIEAGIQKQGFSFISDAKTGSTFKLAAMAVLDKNGEESLNLVTRFGIDPGLGNSQMNHDKGALVLAVTNKDNELLWRGVVQIFTDKDVSEEMRTVRRERAINLLLKELFSKRLIESQPATI
ncbi:MAG: hypothetical protein HRU20_10420 [Pseudomonadales bacterium]|nr:hypothetical protein [Pseudomonadales bacterium]